MKVLHLVFSLNTGGIENMLADIATEQSRFHEVVVVIVNNCVNDAILGAMSPRVAVFRIGRRPGSFSPGKLLKLNLLVNRLSPDVIHCHNQSIVRILWPWLRAPICLTIHDVRIDSSNFGRCDRLFAISESVKHEISQKGGRAELVYNGILTDRVRVRQGALRRPLRLVQVGRLEHAHKGQDIAIKALEIAVKNFGLDDIRMDFIGAGSSLRYLESLVQQAGLSDFVSFLGNRDRNFVYDSLCNYDLLVQPSRYEGFGLTIAEAMAAKVPVLVSDCEGLMEVIGQGKYGSWFRNGSESDLATKLRSIIDNYSGCIAVADVAYDSCCNNYSITGTADAYLLHYQSMLN